MPYKRLNQLDDFEPLVRVLSKAGRKKQAADETLPAGRIFNFYKINQNIFD